MFGVGNFSLDLFSYLFVISALVGHFRYIAVSNKINIIGLLALVRNQFMTLICVQIAWVVNIQVYH